MKFKIFMKRHSFVMMFLCVGLLAFYFYFYFEPLQLFLKSLQREELFKVLPIPIAVIMGFVTIALNDWKVRRRDDEKLKAEKIEALYEASVEYYSSGMQILSQYTHEEVFQAKNCDSGDYKDFKIDTTRFDSVVNKIEMLLGLYFEGEEKEVERYKIIAFNDHYAFESEKSKYPDIKDKLFKNKKRLIDTCFKLSK